MGLIFQMAPWQQWLMLSLVGVAVAGLAWRYILLPLAKGREAERALRESDERCGQLASSVSEVFWMLCGVTGKILYVSPAYEKVFGASCQSLYEDSRQWIARIVAEDRHQVEVEFNAMGERGVFDVEYRIARPDGEIRWIHDHAVPVRGTAAGERRYAGVAQDITVRKRAEAALMASEARFERLKESGIIGIATTDLEGRVFEVNEAMSAMLGYSRAEVQALGWRKITAPGSISADELAVQQIAEAGVCKPFEKQYLRKDGSAVDVLVGAARLAESDGKCITFALDISQFKQAQDALLREKALSDAIISSIPGLFHVLDDQGRFVRWNKAYEAFRGMDAGAMLGGSVHEMFPRQEKERATAGWIELMKVGYGQFETRFESAQGIRNMILNGRVMTTDGRMYVVAIGTDITERKRMEEELYQSRQMLRLILDHIPQRVFWKDQDRRLLGCNMHFAQDMGLADTQAVVGKSNFELASGSIAESYDADDQRVLTRDIALLNFEEKILSPAGTEVWVRTNKVPLHDREGHVIGLLGTYEDMTAARHAREELQAARVAAETASRSKSDFLANMSHEIRTPMAAIIGYAGELLNPSQTAEERTNCVTIIRRNGEHLLALINDILDVSKIDAGQMTVEQIACSPSHIVSEAASLMRIRATAKQLAFEVSFVGPLPETIQSDPTRIRQIVINLLSNAIKFTQKGFVRLEVSMREGPTPGKARLEFAVVDSGVGISQEELGRLFCAFAQADGSTTRRFGGTGLGLVISLKIARMLGGDIVVESTPGKGSTFTASVDAGNLDELALREGCGEAIACNVKTVVAPEAITLTGRVLLAEDGLDNQRLLAAYLRRAGADVTVADNGRKAVEKVIEAVAAGRAFDAILMDMQMPELDGYGATSELRQIRIQCPIIALTAHAMEGDRAKCLRAGCTDYLSKPVKRDVLLKTVSEAIGGSGGGRAARPVLRSCGIDDPVLQECLPEFVAGLPAVVSQLEETLQRGNLEALAGVLHQLKGAGGLYGFDPITASAKQAELANRGRETLEAQTRQVQELIAILRSVEGYAPVVAAK